MTEKRVEMRKDFDEKALFGLFTDKEGCRFFLKKPFVIDGCVYASEEHRIIGIDTVLLKGEYSDGNVPENIANAIRRYNSIPTYCGKPVTAKRLERALASVPLVEEVIEADETKECPECHGRGVVEWYYDGIRRDYEEEFECPECGSEGYVTTTVERRTGRMIPDRDATIGFFSLSCINAYNVQALLDTMNLLGIDEARYATATGISVFVLHEGVKVYTANYTGKLCHVIE